MKKSWTLYPFLIILMVSLIACSQNNTPEEEQQEVEDGEREEESDREEQEPVEEESEESEESMEETEETTAGAEGAYTYNEITIILPEEWEGKYVIEEGEDYLTVYQKSSYELMEGLGYLFSIGISDAPIYTAPSGGTIAYTEDTNYYVAYPTDVAYAYDVPEVAEEYQEMSKDIVDIVHSVTIAGDDVHYNVWEYIFPMSEYALLTENDALCFDANDIYLGWNEILARHGYHFEDPYLQAYFERCSWYEDRGDEYSESDLTDIDVANIAVLQAAEELLRTEYPTELEGEQEYNLDLNMDGEEEIVSYSAEADKWGNATGVIMVNGQQYNMQDFGVYPDSLHSNHFYVTNISPYDTGLELAFADDGPSDDPITYFFSYDGELKYIGSVNGFPMEQLNYINGFRPNFVIGRVRCDVLETCYGYGSWWYDSANGELVFSEVGYYELEPWYSHELLVDLPVHHSMNEESEVETLSAGQTVYFMATDGANWTLVRGEDGTEGWIYSEMGVISELNRNSSEVFEGLFFFD